MTRLNPVSLLAAIVLATAGAVPGVAAPLVNRAVGYEVRVQVDGIQAPSFSHGGQTWVLGRLGDRYTLTVVNRTGRRAEAVVTVDGRDVIDGRPGDWSRKRGYLVPAHGSIEIDGWRVSSEEVAAFRFASVADSYAARTGRARDVGVIGVAVFPERAPRPRPLELPPSASRRDRGGEGGGEPDRSEAGAPAPEGQADVDTAAPRTQQKAEAERRPGLGTEFGEPVHSAVTEVEFVRASSRPEALLGLRYNDRPGLIALGIDVDGVGDGRLDDGERRSSADPFPRVDRGYSAPPAGWPYR